MNKLRRKQGFSLAEMLVVVAIITILGGVVFINVINYQRSMAQFERDNIAKEIFVAAQNHLTMAESQGFLGLSTEVRRGEPDPFGTKDPDNENIRYFVVNGSTSYTGNSLLDQMLPFAAVDETVRMGGSYIIRYQIEPALVLDVFYCSKGIGRFDHTLTSGEYRAVIAAAGDSNKEVRRSFTTDNYVLGWYGGEEGQTLARADDLKPPVIQVRNAERLTVIVKDSNRTESGTPEGVVLKLVLEGEISKAKLDFTLDDSTAADSTGALNKRVIHPVGDSGLPVLTQYVVVLDDITTSGFQFCNISASTMEETGNFLPGENLKIQAVAYNSKNLSNIARSDQKTTNSLFASISSPDVEGQNTATIRNIRHLENLNQTISGVTTNYSNSDVDHPKTLKITQAKQATNLNWTDFRRDIAKNEAPGSPYFTTEDSKVAEKMAMVKIWGDTATTSVSTKDGCYMPISPNYALTYDGDGHHIIDIKVDWKGPAGVFGKLEGSTIKNVLVRNTPENDSDLEIKGTGNTGSTGGLVGVMDRGSIEQCAAAVYVRSGAEAGGLVGTAKNGVKIQNSYAGGHTKNGAYTTEVGELSALITDEAKKGRVNVIGSTAVGGLVGDAGNTIVSYCYSTCSASGNKVGGLAGKASGELSHCYATGLVLGTGTSPTNGALVGDGVSLTSIGNCSYYMSINYNDTPAEGSSKAMPPVGNKSVAEGVTAIDSDVDTYNTVVGDPASWGAAKPYDSTLKTYYKGKYNLKSIMRLVDPKDDPEMEKTLKNADFMSTHYGDWPAPEIMIVNKPQVSGT